MEDADQSLASSFGAVAENYDRYRDSYPSALIQDLLARGATNVLDVGCGTGIASRLFTAQDCAVVGVEPDERMAAVARRHGIPVEVSPFEEWHPAGRRFDLVISATAWHWIDPNTGPVKAASALKSQGTLAPFWNTKTHPPEVMAAIAPIYRRLAPDLLANSNALGTDTGTYTAFADAISSCGPFEPATLRTYPWQRRFTSQAFVEELSTHSRHLLLPSPARRQLLEEVGAAIDRLGGTFISDHNTVAIMARRR